MKLFLSRAFLALGVTIFGFGLALALASEFVYPGPRSLDSGLARVSFAFGGAFVGLVLGVLGGFWLKAPQILRAAAASFLLGAGILGLVAWRAADSGVL